MDVVVIGNSAIDILCYPVDDVPRKASLTFQRSSVGPGGCGSNAAIGLAALGVKTGFVTCIGDDSTADLLQSAWRKAGVDMRYVRRVGGSQTGVSVGLIDSTYQPRFIHYAGASEALTVESIDLEDMLRNGARWLHISSYFILPGLMNPQFSELLKRAQGRGMRVSIDAVESPAMDNPSCLLECLPHVDVFMCNTLEAEHLTGMSDPLKAAALFRSYGVKAVVIKLGARGSLAVSEETTVEVPSQPADPIDTTGAGDAFAAGFVAASMKGKTIEAACREGNEAGRKMVTAFGAVSGWFQTSTDQKGQ